MGSRMREKSKRQTERINDREGKKKNDWKRKFQRKALGPCLRPVHME